MIRCYITVSLIPVYFYMIAIVSITSTKSLLISTEVWLIKLNNDVCYKRTERFVTITKLFSANNNTFILHQIEAGFEQLHRKSKHLSDSFKHVWV